MSKGARHWSCLEEGDWLLAAPLHCPEIKDPARKNTSSASVLDQGFCFLGGNTSSSTGPGEILTGSFKGSQLGSKGSCERGGGAAGVTGMEKESSQVEGWY